MVRIISIVIFIALIGIGGTVYYKYFMVYSEGAREGVVLKVSKKGALFKTYECEIVQAGLRSSSGNLSTNNFKFTAENEAIAKKLESASGNIVKVHYLQYRNSLFWRGDNYNYTNSEPGQYIVNKVEVKKSPEGGFF
jgi:hypothetical protein